MKKPVRISLSKQVLTSMENQIREGLWKVGDRIPAEPELARLFSVSHNTIREAVQSLIHAGILEARPGDGTYVIANDRFAVAMSNKLREAELTQILEARRALEKEIARLAAANRTEDDLQQLESDWQRCLAKTGTGIDDDMRFHASIATSTHNPILAQLYHVIVSYLQDSLGSVLAEKQYDPLAMQLHSELLDAIRTHDANLAESIIVRIVEFDAHCIGND
jgi:DNA-binding FadR family transcriptional regulator